MSARKNRSTSSGSSGGTDGLPAPRQCRPGAWGPPARRQMVTLLKLTDRGEDSRQHRGRRMSSLPA